MVESIMHWAAIVQVALWTLALLFCAAATVLWLLTHAFHAFSRRPRSRRRRR